MLEKKVYSSSSCRNEAAIESQDPAREEYIKKYIEKSLSRPGERLVLEMEASISLCSGEAHEDCFKMCIGNCDEADTCFGKIIVKDNLSRSIFEHDLVVVDKDTPIGVKLLAAKENEIVQFRDADKRLYMIRIIGKP